MAPQTWSEWLQGLLASLRPPPVPGSHEATLEQFRAGERALSLAPGRVHANAGPLRSCVRRRKCAELPATAAGRAAADLQGCTASKLCSWCSHLSTGALLDKELDKPAGQRDEELVWKLRIDYRTIQLKNAQVGGGWAAAARIGQAGRCYFGWL